MANFLTLRTGAGASIFKLDRAFFTTSVLPLLVKRGFPAEATLTLTMDDPSFEKWLGGKVVVPAGELQATAKTWTQLHLAATARDLVGRAGGSRDLSGPAEGQKVQRDWIREKSGRRVKARPNTRTLKQPTAPPAAATSAPSSTVTDPATFAVQNLARLAALVVAAVKGAPDEASVVVKDGNLVVAGVVRGRLEA